MTQQFGQQGEQMVMDHLRDQGFQILTHNYKKFFGEVDIIAKKKDVIAFVEVKARKNSKVSLHSLITYSKQQKIIKVAQTYIKEYGISLAHTTLRFDVALLHLQDQQAPQLTYIPNAFCQTSY